MATVNFSNQQIYPTEQAVLDQFRNGNLPFSKDFSFVLRTPELNLALNEAISLVVPLFKLPTPPFYRAFNWMMEGMVMWDATFETRPPASGRNSFTLAGSTANTTLVSSFLYAPPPPLPTFGADFLLERTAWNKAGHAGHYEVRMTASIGGGAADKGVATIAVVGVHAMLG